MAGINQGRPETAVGEPIRLGSNEEFEIEQHPISDRLIIRDTVNGKVAYVRKERGGQIGGDGVLIKALKESKPMADDGRTYDTIQQAERAASSWVFVPPGTFNETVDINTEGLTLRGSGYNTFVDSSDLEVYASNVAVSNLRTSASMFIGDGLSNVIINSVTVTNSPGTGIYFSSTGHTAVNCRILNAAGDGIRADGENIVSSCYVENPSGDCYNANNSSTIIANCIARGSTDHGIVTNSAGDHIFIGNRIINSTVYGIYIFAGSDIIVANNRISDSGNQDINDAGTGTLLDANLTGASN